MKRFLGETGGTASGYKNHEEDNTGIGADRNVVDRRRRSRSLIDGSEMGHRPFVAAAADNGGNIAVGGGPSSIPSPRLLPFFLPASMLFPFLRRTRIEG